jgi:integral membrane protein (TIGR01906 family)
VSGLFGKVGAVLETAVISVLFVLLLLGVAVGIVAAPGVTAGLIRLNQTWKYTGMSETATVRLADQTRAYVIGGHEAAQTQVAAIGLAYKADELSHLRDVQDVMTGARVATGVVAALLALWIVATMVFRRWAVLRRGVLWGGIAAIAFPGLVAAAAAWDFEGIFTLFHGLFFKAGTWQFPADSMLIRTFPPEFWMWAGATWGAITMLGGLTLLLGALTLPKTDREAQVVSRRTGIKRASRESAAGSSARS